MKGTRNALGHWPKKFKWNINQETQSRNPDLKYFACYGRTGALSLDTGWVINDTSGPVRFVVQGQERHSLRLVSLITRTGAMFYISV